MPLPKKNVVFIPDDSANVPCLLNQMRTQVNALSDPTPSLGDLVNQLDHGAFGGKLLLTKPDKDITKKENYRLISLMMQKSSTKFK